MIGAALGFLTGGSATRLVATLLAGVAIGGTGAWKVQAWRHGHNEAQRIEQAARATLREIERRDRITTDHTTEQADADQQHTRIIERVRVINAGPGAAVQCLTADGLRALGAAIDNGAPTPARPGLALPTAGPAS